MKKLLSLKQRSRMVEPANKNSEILSSTWFIKGKRQSLSSSVVNNSWLAFPVNL